MTFTRQEGVAISLQYMLLCVLWIHQTYTLVLPFALLQTEQFMIATFLLHQIRMRAKLSYSLKQIVSVSTSVRSAPFYVLTPFSTTAILSAFRTGDSLAND